MIACASVQQWCWEGLKVINWPVCVSLLEAFDLSAEILTLFHFFVFFPAFMSEHDICILFMSFFSVLLLLTSWHSIVKPSMHNSETAARKVLKSRFA